MPQSPDATPARRRWVPRARYTLSIFGAIAAYLVFQWFMGMPTMELERVASGFNQPTAMIEVEGDFWIAEREGIVRRMSDHSVVLDLTDRVVSDFYEQGLLGMVRDGDELIVNYTGETNDTFVSAIDLADGSERNILRIDQPYPEHNGGNLAFGPDGYLYISVGDGGSELDADQNGQDPYDLFGSILRIDVSSGDGYTIPADNPFADGVDGAPEVFAYGLRNPWRFSFDSETGDLYIADVGEQDAEEIDLIEAGTSGQNFGWVIMEGSKCFTPPGHPEVKNCDIPADHVGPAIEIRRPEHLNCTTVTGGVVYRGDRYPQLRDRYVFADWCTGAIRSAPTPVDGSSQVEVYAPASITNVMVSNDGEIYMADFTGEIWTPRMLNPLESLIHKLTVEPISKWIEDHG